MGQSRTTQDPAGLDRRGFTLMETVVAALVTMIIFFGLARIYAGGQAQLQVEENHRKAVAVAQAHLDAFRRDHRFEDLVNTGLDGGGQQDDGDHDDDDDDDDWWGWWRDGHDENDDGNDSFVPGTTYTIDGMDFVVTESVQVGVPEEHAATLEIEVSWNDEYKGDPVPRSFTCTSILGRSLK